MFPLRVSERTFRVLGVWGLAGLLAVGATGAAHAQTIYTVDTTVDEADDGECATDCTLREAIATASFEDGVSWWQANEEAIDTDAYTFSKEAVVVYTMHLAGKGLARGIRVNDDGPGPVDTPILPDFTKDAGAEAMQQMIDMVGRAAQPADIAEALVVLAEGQISWLNGQHIIVDGGMTAGYSSGWGR